MPQTMLTSRLRRAPLVHVRRNIERLLEQWRTDLAQRSPRFAHRDSRGWHAQFGQTPAGEMW